MTQFQVNSSNVIHETIDGEVVLINLETGIYYSIDRVGAVVWNHLEKGLSSNQIVAAITSQFDGEQADIAAAIQRLFDDLQSEQLIVPGEATSTDGQVPGVSEVVNAGAKLSFEAPVLNKYTDMEDLLLLDPIHDVDESGWPNTNPNNVIDV